MLERDFVFWLNGLFELSDVKTLDEKQVKIIKEHLALVFEHAFAPALPPGVEIPLESVFTKEELAGVREDMKKERKATEDRKQPSQDEVAKQHKLLTDLGYRISWPGRTAIC